MLRYDAGHLIIDPIFASQYYRDTESDCFLAVDIDDCDCEMCSKDRGPIPQYTTISVGLVAGKARVSQRLTIDEARKLAKTLIDYAKVLESIAEIGNEEVDLT